MMTASMKTWRRGWSSSSMTLRSERVVAQRRRDDDRVGRLVGGDASRRPRRSRSAARPLPAGAAAGTPPGRAVGRRAGEDLVQRLRELFASACWSGSTWISPSPVCGTSMRLMSSRMRRYARSVATMMSELVRSSATILATCESPVARRPPPVPPPPGARPRAALHVEDLVDALRDLGRGRVVDRLDPDLIARAADVDLLEDLRSSGGCSSRCR